MRRGDGLAAGSLSEGGRSSNGPLRHPWL